MEGLEAYTKNEPIVRNSVRVTSAGDAIVSITKLTSQRSRVGESVKKTKYINIREHSTQRTRMYFGN